MATKRGSTKKSSTKKSAGKKAAKKSTKKSASRESIAAAGFPTPINLRCILACVERYNQCIKKGVDRATCQKRLGRCIQRCVIGGTADPGPDDE